jgi:hypothetical protein
VSFSGAVCTYAHFQKVVLISCLWDFQYTTEGTAFLVTTLESGIDVGQGINVGPGKFAKKNKHRALNKRRASGF